jgi:D-alanyl-D-alanine dipeptidase
MHCFRVSQIVLLSDERVAGLPVIECGEILCDLREIPALRVEPRRADPTGAYAHVRAGVADRLVAAQSLLPPGLRLLVIEGYRPVALQRRHFDEFCARLAAENPEWTLDQVRLEAGRHVAPPELAPHTTGGAVDLTVCREDGTLSTSAEVCTLPDDDACYTAATSISAEARANREILGRVLSDVGLVNFPTEWWHWSYGDRYWAFVTGRPAARYGAVQPPTGG